jgi:Asp-tRNA(Asn)/Glu-tRNA(Gln) amidotransferase C subunit
MNTEGGKMDSKRLKELEKLAGLTLDPTERGKMLADLVCLEKFVARLPEVQDTTISGISIGHQENLIPIPREMDPNVVRENAPSQTHGFFEIPPIATGGQDKSK